MKRALILIALFTLAISVTPQTKVVGPGGAQGGTPSTGGSSVPIVIGSVSLVNQNAALGAVNLAVAPVAGLYRACSSLFLTTLGTSGTINVSFGGNNGTFGYTSPVGGAVTVSTATSRVNACICEHAIAGAQFTYVVQFVSVVGSPVYSFDFTLERME